VVNSPMVYFQFLIGDLDLMMTNPGTGTADCKNRIVVLMQAGTLSCFLRLCYYISMLNVFFERAIKNKCTYNSETSA
jgi:hypothetical protein